MLDAGLIRYGKRQLPIADRDLRFNNLLHHVTVLACKRDAASGVDGMEEPDALVAHVRICAGGASVCWRLYSD